MKAPTIGVLIPVFLSLLFQHSPISAQAEPSDETLSRLFATLATGREFGGKTGLIRWDKPITYVIVSNKSSTVEKRVPHSLETFANIAGLTLQQAEITPSSDTSVFPDNLYTSADGFRAQLEVKFSNDPNKGSYYLVTWGVGNALKKAEANVAIFVADR